MHRGGHLGEFMGNVPPEYKAEQSANFSPSPEQSPPLDSIDLDASYEALTPEEWRRRIHHKALEQLSHNLGGKDFSECEAYLNDLQNNHSQQYDQVMERATLEVNFEYNLDKAEAEYDQRYNQGIRNKVRSWFALSGLRRLTQATAGIIAGSTTGAAASGIALGLGGAIVMDSTPMAIIAGGASAGLAGAVAGYLRGKQVYAENNLTRSAIESELGINSEQLIGQAKNLENLDPAAAETQRHYENYYREVEQALAYYNEIERNKLISDKPAEVELFYKNKAHLQHILEARDIRRTHELPLTDEQRANALLMVIEHSKQIDGYRIDHGLNEAALEFIGRKRIGEQDYARANARKRGLISAAVGAVSGGILGHLVDGYFDANTSAGAGTLLGAATIDEGGPPEDNKDSFFPPSEPERGPETPERQFNREIHGIAIKGMNEYPKKIKMNWRTRKGRGLISGLATELGMREETFKKDIPDDLITLATIVLDKKVPLPQRQDTLNELKDNMLAYTMHLAEKKTAEDKDSKIPEEEIRQLNSEVHQLTLTGMDKLPPNLNMSWQARKGHSLIIGLAYQHGFNIHHFQQALPADMLELAYTAQNKKAPHSERKTVLSELRDHIELYSGYIEATEQIPAITEAATEEEIQEFNHQMHTLTISGMREIPSALNITWRARQTRGVIMGVALQQSMDLQYFRRNIPKELLKIAASVIDRKATLSQRQDALLELTEKMAAHIKSATEKPKKK